MRQMLRARAAYLAVLPFHVLTSGAFPPRSCPPLRGPLPAGIRGVALQRILAHIAEDPPRGVMQRTFGLVSHDLTYSSNRTMAVPVSHSATGS